jgi:uncharacterized protein
VAGGLRPSPAIPVQGANPGRDERIDALRGFALLGILLVNIQSFVWGGGNPAGYLTEGAGTADRLMFFVTVTFINLKFMPLFAMLFGVGFGLLLEKLRMLTSAPQAVFRRRMLFLFAFGVLHGAFLYYGDITHMYAIAGLVLLGYADRDTAGIRRALTLWWAAAVVLTALLALALAGEAPDPVDVAAEVQRNFVVSTEQGYLGQFPVRFGLFLDIVFSNLVSMPLTVALMLTGMFVQRSGWLADRGAPAWPVVRAAGLAIGLPAALVYGGLLYVQVDAYGLGAYSDLSAVPGVISVVLAFAYAATFLVYAPSWLVRWLAPAGRMPLTNYLLQSVAMGVLLSGWGLALAPRLGYAQTSLVAVAVFASQVVLSRWWLRRWPQGPLELLWRRWTYRRMPPPIGSSKVKSEE